MLQPAQLGFYVIAVDLVERLWILTGAVANSLLPHLANLPERDPETAATVTRHVMIWTGAGCLLVFIFADVMVHLLYSSVFVPVEVAAAGSFCDNCRPAFNCGTARSGEGFLHALGGDYFYAG